MDFKDDAACRTMDNALFFPVKDDITTEQYYKAQQICRSCPVSVECLLYALENNISEGLFAVPAKVRKRFKSKDINDWDEALDEAYQVLDIMEPKFDKEGKLTSKRCLRCNRFSKGYAEDYNNYMAKSHICVSCHIKVQNNKHIDKLLFIEKKPSKAMPEFNYNGELVSKKCTRCWKRQDADNFVKRPKGIGEKTSWCKECLNKNLAAWHSKKK